MDVSRIAANTAALHRSPPLWYVSSCTFPISGEREIFEGYAAGHAVDYSSTVLRENWKLLASQYSLFSTGNTKSHFLKDKWRDNKIRQLVFSQGKGLLIDFYCV